MQRGGEDEEGQSKPRGREQTGARGREQTGGPAE